jgi:hypothetical protein
MGKAVEDLFWKSDLLPENQHSITCYAQFDVDAEAKPLLGDSEACWQLSNQEKELTDLKEIFDNDNEVFGMKQGTAAIDFAGPGRKVYQVTVSDNHRMSLSGMISILEQGGYLDRDERGYLKMHSSPSTEPLNFYWVVPYGVRDKWIKKNPFSYQDSSREAEADNEQPEQKQTNRQIRKQTEKQKKLIVKKCMDQNVRQYAIVMEVVMKRAERDASTELHRTDGPQSFGHVPDS